MNTKPAPGAMCARAARASTIPPAPTMPFSVVMRMAVRFSLSATWTTLRFGNFFITSAATPAFWERAGFTTAVADDRFPVMRRELA